MSGRSATVGTEQDAYWWQGSRMTIKARGETTGGLLGLTEGSFYRGFGPPLHVHRREDEGMYVIEGEIRFRQGPDELIGGPGTWVWMPRGIEHTFKVESESARALVIITPAGFEQMFVEGGIPVGDSPEPPAQEYDPEAAKALAERFGFEVVGPPLS